MQRQGMAFRPSRNEKYVTDIILWKSLTSSRGFTQYILFSSLYRGEGGVGVGIGVGVCNDAVPSPGIRVHVRKREAEVLNT